MFGEVGGPYQMQTVNIAVRIQKIPYIYFMIIPMLNNFRINFYISGVVILFLEFSYEISLP